VSATVVSINQRGLLTKKELAEHIGRSDRWIEQQQHKGLPVAERNTQGWNLYKLADVEAWMRQERPKTTEQRLTAVEAELATLRELLGPKEQ
jgi:phage terminase Nu1 subunit (DNA packaging protein)